MGDRFFSLKKTSHDILLGAILLVFFLGLLPPAASFVFYSAFPEHHYTDAAIPMFRSHDLLDPVQHDGSARLLKPPFTYWLMIGTYRILGVSAFSSRLIFLLAGCATIWLAYEIAFKLTGERRVARIAALILLSQPLIIAVSIRSLPDILLTFFLLLSCYGFIRLICLGDFRPISYWTAYGGAALAIETKGLLGLLFVIYALAFAWITASPERRLGRIVNIKAGAIALLIACVGFVLMFWRHGDAFLQSFWGDQVGQKLDLQVIHLSIRIAGFILILLVSCLPWLVCLIYLFLKRPVQSPFTVAEQRSCLFLAVWCLLLPFVFGFGNLLSLRYMVPATPFLAIAIAVCLCRFPEGDLTSALRPFQISAIVCFLAISIFGLLLFNETGVTRSFPSLAVLLLLIGFVALQWREERLSPAVRFSFSYFLFWPLVFSIACPFKLPDESAAIARELRTASPARNSLILVGDLGLGSRVRIVSGGLYPVYRFETLPENALARLDQSLLILSQSQAQRLSAGSFQLRRIGSGLSEFAWREFIIATLTGEARCYIDGRIEGYYTATPVTSQ